MRYYIKELLNQNYEIVAMDGYDAYVSITIMKIFI